MSLIRSPALPTALLPPLPWLNFVQIRDKLSTTPTASGVLHTEVVATELEPASTTAHRSAVLILLIGAQDRPEQVLFTTRTRRLSSHAGQVSFPGGRSDEKDASANATALRETEEETGIPAHLIEVLGQLEPLHSHTGYLITPVVGRLAALPVLHLNPHEVDHAFTVPFDFLLNPRHHFYHALTDSRDLESAPVRYTYAIPFAGFDLWGLSALIVRRLYARLLS